MEKEVLPLPEIIVKVDQIQEDKDADSSSSSHAIVSTRRGLLSLIAGLLCVYLFVEFLSRVKRNKNLYSECNSSEVQIDSEPADVIDVDCAYLRTQLRTFEFDRIVTSQNGNKCTIKNAGNIVDNLLKRFARIPRPLTDRFLVSQPDYVTDIADKPYRSDNSMKKAGLHLVGSFNTTRREMSWENLASAGDLILTRDSSKVVVPRDGNYFIFATVKFRRSGFHSLPYSIFVQNRFGVREFEHLQIETEHDSVGKQSAWNVKGIVYMMENDNVYINVPTTTERYVSPDEDAHIFGIFEI